MTFSTLFSKDLSMKKLLTATALILSLACPAFAAPVIELPVPQRSGGMPLMDTLNARHTERSFSSESLTLQQVSDLLWATCGVNRPDGKRTIPTAMNHQRIALYAVMKDGVYLYDAKQNILQQILAGEEYLKQYKNGAPLVLLHAAPTDDRFSPCHIGSMYQNAALYCASAGLATVPKAQETGVLDGKLPLEQGWSVFIVQPVGYPAR